MPPSQQKISEISARRAVVRRLLEIGLRQSEISSALGLTRTEVNYDISKMTEEIDTTNEPAAEREEPKSAYCEALRAYAGLAAGLVEDVDGLRDALRVYLDIDHLNANCEGIAAALDIRVSSPMSKRLYAYKRLAMYVCAQPEDKDISGDRILSDFLNAVQRGEVDPQERKAMPEALTKWAIANYHIAAALPMTEKAAQYIENNILRTLYPREERVLIQRWGLADGRVRTFDEVGQDFGISKHAVQSIDSNAIRKLRHPSRFKFLVVFTQPMEVLAGEIVDKEMWRKDNSHFDRRVDKCGFSYSVSTLLTEAGIVTMGQLCSMAEFEVLRLRNATESTLTEVKSVLNTMELALTVKKDLAALPEPRPAWYGKRRSIQMTDGVHRLDISPRAVRGLASLGVETVADLARVSEMQLMEVPNLGQKTVQEIKKAAEKQGIALGTSLPDDLHSLSAAPESEPEPQQPTEALPIPTETRMTDFYWVIGNRGSKERCYPAHGEKLTDWELMAYVAFNAAFDSRYSVEPDG
jgi:hypothetical protein